MDLAEAVDAIRTTRSIKVDAINLVNFMVYLYLLCFDDVCMLSSLLFYLCLCRVLVDEVLMILTLMSARIPLIYFPCAAPKRRCP